MLRPVVRKNENLLLCFDAFGTLFTPKEPIPEAYAKTAARHGIHCGDGKDFLAVGKAFKQAFKEESKVNPNYGKATGLGAQRWWGNVIRNTFKGFLQPGQQVPPVLVTELLQRYSGKAGYSLYPDVKDFFNMLKDETGREGDLHPWCWNRTVVGIITNSDDRVPSILRDFGLNVGPRRFGKPDERSREEVSLAADDINFVVLSYDVGFEKPSRRIFDAAIDMLRETLAVSGGKNLTVDDFCKVYVGDDLEKDYDGAEAAGWDAMLLNRDADENLTIAKHDVRDRNGTPRAVNMVGSLRTLQRLRPQKSGLREKNAM